MKQGTIKEIGPQAIDKNEKMLIFFGDQATEMLREYSVIQALPDSQDIVVKNGNTISFGEQIYTVTHVGPVANQTLQTIQHVTFIFDEAPEEQLTSAIYLKPFHLPTLEVGMKVIYK
jgi:PTS system glucitol/sorbitol-specific IIA component